MESLKNAAEQYVPPQTDNITTLEKIPIDVELHDGEGKDKDGETFKYKYIEHEGKKYRVPGTVIGGIKMVLNKYPETKFVTVDKEGIGMATKYHVMPYVEPVVKEEEVK